MKLNRLRYYRYYKLYDATMTLRTIYNANNNFVIYCKLLCYPIMKYGRINGGEEKSVLH